MNFSACIVFFLFFVNLSNAHAYTLTEETIDDQIEKSKQEFAKLNFYQSISYAKEALDDSEKIAYSKGKTIASIYLAKGLIEIGEYKKALSFIVKAEREEFFNSYINMQVESYRLKGRLYGSLDMNLLAEKEFKKQLLHSERIANRNQREMSIFWSYQNLVHIYDKTKKKDSLDKYLVLQENSVHRLEEAINFYSISATYCQIARNLMKNKKFQEAKNYLDKSNNILHKYNSRYLFQYYDCYATYEKLTGNLKEAERYYDLALQNALELKDLDAIVGQYKNMSDFFINDMKDVKTGKKYLLLYHKYNDSLRTINSNIQDDVYNEILKEKYEVARQVGGSYEYIVLGVLLIGLVPIGFIYYRKIKYKRKIKVLETEIDDHSRTMQSEIEDSRHKELMTAANTNSPDFPLLFEELYPEVVAEIKKRNSNVLSSDIAFLGMAHLNFSTKDLANILNVTVRAIQVRKNRLRKKYNISSDIDFNLWYSLEIPKENNKQ